MSIITEVRAELQLPESLIKDSDITYVVNKLGANGGDINLVCAEVLRMVVRKYRGKIRMRVGKYEEVIDLNTLKQEIANFMNRSGATKLDDGFEYPETFSITDFESSNL